jgi:hypothetical protein
MGADNGPLTPTHLWLHKAAGKGAGDAAYLKMGSLDINYKSDFHWEPMSLPSTQVQKSKTTAHSWQVKINQMEEIII